MTEPWRPVLVPESRVVVVEALLRDLDAAEEKQGVDFG